MIHYLLGYGCPIITTGGGVYASIIVLQYHALKYFIEKGVTNYDCKS